MTVGRGGYGSYRNAVGVYDHRAFETLLAPIYRASTRLLASTGSLCDAAIYGHVGQIEADHPVVGIEHYPL
jgi:hypothetical protein